MFYIIQKRYLYLHFYFKEIETDIYIQMQNFQKKRSSFFKDDHNDGIAINDFLSEDKVDSHIECFERTFEQGQIVDFYSLILLVTYRSDYKESSLEWGLHA